MDTSAISATYENRLLTVTIPMAERAKPRRITVEHSGDKTAVGQRRESQPIEGHTVGAE